MDYTDEVPDPPAAEDPLPLAPAPLHEALFAPSTVRLFGRPYIGLELNVFGLNPASNSPLALLLEKASAVDSKFKPRLARIYGFSYMGAYYKLAEVPVMLVYGEGFEVPHGMEDSVRKAGFEFSDGMFLKDVRMWALDRMDYGVRIDVSIGWLNDILMADAMDDCGPPDDPDSPQPGGRAYLQSRMTSRMASRLTSRMTSR